MEINEEEVFANKYWQINRFMLKMIGLWPYQKRYVKICIRTFLLFAIHTMMIPQMIKTYFEWGKNFEIVVENITGFFFFQTCIAKYITYIISESQLQYLYERVTEDWKTFTKQGEQIVLSATADHGRVLTIGYTVGLYIIGTGFTILPVALTMVLDLVIPLNTSRDKVLCFYGEYFIDQQKYYYELFFHTVVCIWCLVSLFTTLDSTYVNCVQHVIGLFQLVEYYLSEAYALTRIKSKSQTTDLEIHDYVLRSISLHQRSIEFVDLLQTTYTTCFFVTTGMYLIALSLGTVDLMMGTNNYVNFIRILFAWFGLILYLFYVSMPGQRIIDTSSKITSAIFFSGWQEFPLRTQKLLRFMMLRGSVPCQFTAGPLLVMCLANCGAIMKSAMSYCTFVAAMK